MWRVTQVSGQWVPKHRTGYWKCQTTICCKPVRLYNQLMAGSRTKMLSMYRQLSRLERNTQLDTGEQNRTDIGVWSHRVCTWHAWVRQASGAHYAGSCLRPWSNFRVPLTTRAAELTLVATCWWCSLEPQRRQCYSSSSSCSRNEYY